MPLKPAIFLDRDGTINVEKHYLYKISDWEWIEGAKESIKRFHEAGYLVIVVSNQSGIAQGMYGKEDVQKLHDFVQQELKASGTYIDAFYFCPHHTNFGSEADKNCDCRKPKPGMLLKAAQEHTIDLSRSWMVGDKIVDTEAGKAAGARSLMVLTGHGQEHAQYQQDKQIIVADIATACDIIRENTNL